MAHHTSTIPRTPPNRDEQIRKVPARRGVQYAATRHGKAPRGSCTDDVGTDGIVYATARLYCIAKILGLRRTSRSELMQRVIHLAPPRPHRMPRASRYGCTQLTLAVPPRPTTPLRP